MAVSSADQSMTPRTDLGHRAGHLVAESRADQRTVGLTDDRHIGMTQSDACDLEQHLGRSDVGYGFVHQFDGVGAGEGPGAHAASFCAGVTDRA